MFKRTFSILLALLLVFNSAGFVLVYYQLQYFFQLEARASLSSYIPEELVTKIIIHKDGSNPDIEWIDEGEVKVNGKMFDILKREISETNTVLVCISDDKENRLHEVFDDLFIKEYQTSDTKTASINILKNLIKNALVPEKENLIYICGKQRPQPFILEEVLTPFLDVSTPPPKNLS